MLKWIIAALVAATIWIGISGARAADAPIPDYCVLVREKVSEYGKIHALLWAIENGYTREQIALARKCLAH